MSTFPGSPRLARGGIVLLDATTRRVLIAIIDNLAKSDERGELER